MKLGKAGSATLTRILRFDEIFSKIVKRTVLTLIGKIGTIVQNHEFSKKV